VGILRHSRLMAEDTIDNLRDQLRARSLERINIRATGVTEETLTSIRALESVSSADAFEWGIMVLAEPRSNIQAEVNELLVRGGAEVYNLFTLEPSLEDVFLDVTGGEGGV